MSEKSKVRAVYFDKGSKPSSYTPKTSEGWPCWYFFLISFVILTIFVVGLLIRGYAQSWSAIPVEIFIILLLSFLVIFLLLLILSFKRPELRQVVIIMLIVIIIFSILITATTTQYWPEMWAWVSLLVLISIISAFSGIIVGFEILRRCRELWRYKRIRLLNRLETVGIRHRNTKNSGILNVQVKDLALKSYSKPRKTSSLSLHPAMKEIKNQPNRFIGPFTNTEFAEIKVLLHNKGLGAPVPIGKCFAYWYFNEFFLNTSNAHLYKRYFDRRDGEHKFPENNATPSLDGTGTFPNQPDPRRPGGQTGGFPSEDGAQGILLTLKSVHYSSKYGGSIQLKFDSEEEKYLEFRFGDYYFDLDSLKMSVYVVPDPLSLNPVAIEIPGESPSYLEPKTAGVYTEFEPEVRTIYEKLDICTVCGYSVEGDLPDSCPECGALKTKFQDIIRPIVEEENFTKTLEDFVESLRVLEVPHRVHQHNPLGLAVRPAEVSFTYGFLHALHSADLPDITERPDRISISDDHYELHSHRGMF
ncbi:MAG: rubredoxin-like domain-containing protein, partial [Candidatus Hodarchaeales archaeon]